MKYTLEELKVMKQDGIDAWQYLYDYPSIDRKHKLPSEIFNRIINYDMDCSLCEVYYNNLGSCANCPLTELHNQECFSSKNIGWYGKWVEAKTPTTRKKYAGLILDVMKNWDIESLVGTEV